MVEASASRVVKLRSLSSKSVSPMFVDIDIRGAERVRGRFELAELQGLSLVRSQTRGGAFQVVRSATHISASKADVVYACVPLRGSIALTQSGRTCMLSRGDIGLMDARTEYHLDMSDELDSVWIRLVPDALESRSGSTDRIVARRLDGSSGLGFVASRFILATASQVDVLKHAASAPLASILLDLLCAAADVVDVPAKLQPRRSGTRTLERAKEFIELHLGEEDLGPAQIAAGAGISVRYLHDLFVAEGTTTMQWLLDKRLTQARDALAGQEWLPGCIADVAYRHGFGNVASFNRSFKRAYAIAPRQLMVVRGKTVRR